MWDMYLGEASLMRWRILLFLVLGAATFGATPSDDDGFLPAESKLVSLGCLPAAPDGVDSRCVARLAASGRPIVLYQGQLVTLVERTEDPLVGWTPPNGAEPILDFCWLDGQTLVLMRETCLDFIRGGKLVRGVILASKGMRLARADAGHCYVFGGEGGLQKHDVLLYGMDGNVRNLLRAPRPVTAVSGDGSNTFVAVGSVVFLLKPGQKAKAVFYERVCIKDLAVAPPGGIFYLTEDGVGYIESPESGVVFLRRKVASLDSRSGELVLVTKDREILLIKPVSGFSRAVREVRKFLEGKR
jgi:hypothetical protein